jgi:hypothetical protein
MPVRINIAAEDELSEAVLRRMLTENRGHVEVAVSLPIKKGWQMEGGKSGYGYIRKQLPAFNAASSKVPHIVFLDLDDRDCAPKMIRDWLFAERQSPRLLVRVAIREIEAWLLADQQGMAEFLHVKSNCVPANPETLKDPKKCIVRLAARSRVREIRESLAPAAGTHSTVGPYFSRGLIGFVQNTWDLHEAAKHSESMRKALNAVVQFRP